MTDSGPIYEGAIGVTLLSDTGQDLSAATKMQFEVTKPDGTAATWEATESDEVSGSLTYTTQAGDLASAGRYIYQAYVEWGESSHHWGKIEILVISKRGEFGNIDAVRLELGKGQSDDLLTDTEVSYFLGRAANNVLLAASFCAESIAGTYAGMVDKSMGGSSVSLSQKAEAWRKKAAALKAMALSPSITPRASSSAARALKFGIGQHDNPSLSGYSITGYL